MRIFHKQRDLKVFLDNLVTKNKTIGFVPTMGALHEGHLSLIINSKKDNAVTVASIFINPTQFNDAADYEKYPITVDTDIEKLVKTGCDVLFMPEKEEMYTPGEPIEKFELGNLENILEGKFRPGHFQGVAVIVFKLLTAVNPNRLYLGQKDFQQVKVIKKIIANKELGTDVVVVPTLREASGLAMSSRNLRLSKSEKEMATQISRQLKLLCSNIQPGPLAAFTTSIEKDLEKNGLKTDYISVNSQDDLSPVTNWDGKQKIVALAAAYAGEIRLIDNMLIN